MALTVRTSASRSAQEGPTTTSERLAIFDLYQQQFASCGSGRRKQICSLSYARHAVALTPIDCGSGLRLGVNDAQSALRGCS
jgi:hypothetical protein